MKSKNIFLAVLLLGLFHAHAAILPNAINSEVRLGVGIDPDLERVFESCVEFDLSDVSPADARPSHSADPITAKNFNLSTDLVTTSRQVDEYTHTSVSANIQFMAYSGNFSLDSTSQYDFAADQLALGIKADADYGRWFLNHVQLKPEMKALAQQDLKAFYRKCGHEYVVGYSMGQGLSVLLSTVSRSEFSKEDLNVKGGAKASVGELAAGAEAAFTSMAASLLRYGSLQVRVSGFGGGGLDNNSTLITTERDLKKFSDEISARVSKFKPSEATKTNFITSQYPDVDSQYLDVLYNGRRNTLQNLYSDFRKVSSELNRLREVVRTDFEKQYGALCKYEGLMTCHQYGSYLTELLRQDEAAIAAINDAARKCVAADSLKDCATPNIYVLNPNLGKTLWPEEFRGLLYQAQVDAVRRR